LQSPNEVGEIGHDAFVHSGSHNETDHFG
jgi:hypothetical protein